MLKQNKYRMEAALVESNKDKHWILTMSSIMSDGLSRSAWLAGINTDEMAQGREICLILWPFIQQLPANIQAVRDKFAAEHTSSISFLDRLSDEELHYQNLYKDQCKLAGLDDSQLESAIKAVPSPIIPLIDCTNHYCRQGNLLEGVQAIIAAEIAATQFSRRVLDIFEKYFSQHTQQYGTNAIENGLKWLRLHASPNTRQALSMKRMLNIAEAEASQPISPSLPNNLPVPVDAITQAVFTLWQVPGANKPAIAQRVK